MPTAAILTIGNELTSGDVADTNGSWLASRLERIGVRVAILAAVPDEIDAVARFIRREAPEADFVLVTGGLGGTPDDLTREAIAAAFGVGQESCRSSPTRFARASRATLSTRRAGRRFPSAVEGSRIRSAAHPGS